MSSQVERRESLSWSRVTSGSLIVAGTAIGAGMLGIPFVTAKAGFLGAWTVTLGVWLFMLLTGLFYVEVTLQMPPGANIFSMVHRYLGRGASLFSGLMFLFLYYCLMTAYFSGSAPLVQRVVQDVTGYQLSGTVSLWFFAMTFSGLIYLGAKAIDRGNALLMAGMIAFYFLLVGMGLSVKTSYPLSGEMNWMPMVGAVPILFGAFGYHNVIPSLCDYLKQDRRALNYSIVIGTVISLVVYLLWQTLILRCVSFEIIEATLREGKSPIFALQQSVSNPYILFFATYFSICALATSVLGVGLSLVDFLRDAFHSKGMVLGRFVLVLFALLPPLLIAVTCPTIFYAALSWAGGFGESFLNGLLPILLVWAGRYRLKETRLYRAPGEKQTLILLAAVAIGVMAIEMIF